MSKKEREREAFLQEKKCLGTALEHIGPMHEGIRETKSGWVYLDETGQKKLISSIREHASKLMALGTCGELTSEINKLGEIVYGSARPKTGWGSGPSLYWWADDHREKMESQCEDVSFGIKWRLNDLSEILSKPMIFPPDPDDLLEAMFSVHYESLNTSVKKSEMTLLKNYNDQDIRDRLVTILRKSDAIPKTEKTKLKSLGSTGHSGYEISDFAVRVEYNNQQYDMHFVIKSGREIKKKVKEENVWHQITKPIDEGFDFVVFLSFADLTLPLRNRFSKYNKERDCLRYIVNEDLAILFKNYGELS